MDTKINTYLVTLKDKTTHTVIAESYKGSSEEESIRFVNHNGFFNKDELVSIFDAPLVESVVKQTCPIKIIQSLIKKHKAQREFREDLSFIGVTVDGYPND